WDDIKEGYQMILFTDSKENVEYAIVVDMSTYENAAGNDVIYSDVQDLYDRIWNNAHPVHVPELTIVDNVDNATMPETSTVDAADTATFDVTADTGYSLPANLALTLVGANSGAAASYNSATGTVTVTGLTQD